MKIKKLLSLVLSIAVCMVLSVPCLAVADMEGPVTDRQGVLYVLTENVRIVAPESMIQKYTHAKTDEEKAELLNEMKADPRNHVSGINEGELCFVSADEVDEVITEPAMGRTVGTYTLRTNYEIQSGKIMQLSRSGGVAYTLAEGEVMKIILYFEGTRTFGVRTAASTPTFYDIEGETYTDYYGVDVCGLAETGKDRCFVYVKNFSKESMVVLEGTYVQIY